MSRTPPFLGLDATRVSTPVSYTHLDVYKRQTSASPNTTRQAIRGILTEDGVQIIFVRCV